MVNNLRVGIHQPNFNPYLGVIAKYLLSDVFVHLDTVQFVKNEFQNRNKILLDGHAHWLTIPVLHGSGMRIKETRIDTRNPWQKKHLQTLKQAYARTPRFKSVYPWFEDVYRFSTDSMSEWNLHFLSRLYKILEIDTPVYSASSMETTADDPDERLISLCRQLKASTYLAGSGGPSYMDRTKWAPTGLDVEFLKYEHPIYRQGGADFVPYCGVIDLLFRFPSNEIRELALSGVTLSGWDS